MIKTDFNRFTSKFVTGVDKGKFRKQEKRLLSDLISGELSYLNDINSFVSMDELNNIISVANYIRENCDVFVIIGIGGSYMGSKAIMEALLPTFEKGKPEIIFLGTDLSSDYYKEVIEYIRDKQVILNVISKSGNTLEPNIAFEIISYIMEGKYSEEELKDRIIITTDKKEGSLRRLAKDEGYYTFEIPKKIGGRFSVFTPVGLLPLAVAGIDVLKLLEGFMDAVEYIPVAIDYAVTRETLFKKGKTVEAFTVYNPKLYYFLEWTRQLFAETEGKMGKGILPTINVNTRDLHSMGQFLQDGNPIIFETVIGIEQAEVINIAKYNKTLNDINKIAQEKVCLAHYDGKTPSNIINIDYLDEYNLGMLVRFFITAAISSALLIDVDPFNQPGVEKYKKLIADSLNNIFIF